MTKPNSQDEREVRILDAASRLIRHYGYDKTTVSDIAKEAGISKGAIYLHFDSKESLFDALLQREARAYSLYWLELMQADPNAGTFAGIFKNILYSLQKNEFMLAIFKRDSHILGAMARRDHEMFNRKGGINRELVSAMQQVNAVRSDISPETIAFIINIISYGLIGINDVMDVDDETPSVEDTIEGLALLLDAGLRPEDGGDLEAGKAVVMQIVSAATQNMYPPSDSSE